MLHMPYEWCCIHIILSRVLKTLLSWQECVPEVYCWHVELNFPRQLLDVQFDLWTPKWAHCSVDKFTSCSVAMTHQLWQTLLTFIHMAGHTLWTCLCSHSKTAGIFRLSVAQRVTRCILLGTHCYCVAQLWPWPMGISKLKARLLTN